MKSFFWEFVIWVLPTLLLAVIGTAAGYWGAGFGLAFIWAGFCVYQGTIIVKQNTYVVIERFGKFRTVFFAGWRVRVLLVDRIHGEVGSLSAKSLLLYADENGPAKRAVIDFTDASAPISAKVWYQVGKHDDVANQRWNEIEADVKKWTYDYADAIVRIDSLVDAELRPRLQNQKLEEVNANHTIVEGIIDKVIELVGPELEKMGVYPPTTHKLLVIEDIDLPPGVVDLRQLALEGEKKALKGVNESAGYWKAIEAISKNLGVSVQEARAIYETQRGLDVLRETKPTMNLVGKDFGGVLGTINLGNK